MTNLRNPSRRQFLKRSAASFIALSTLPDQIFVGNRDGSRFENSSIFGRVLFDNVPTFAQPDINSMKNGSHPFNEVLPLRQPTKGISSQSGNEIWFPLSEDTYIQSKNVQIVRNILNTPRDDVPKSGRLGEITVPLTEAWPTDKQKSPNHQMFFYGSVHWVYGLGKDPDDNLYYLVIEDRWNESYYVDATHMRIIEDEDLAPISPDLTLEEKHILVDTSKQMLFAYERETLVMACGVSTGLFENGINLSTPKGEFVVHYKRPTRHMVHSDKIGVNDSELYGVPWVSYFTDNGIAFHGTYWHNDYTQPKSHGCVNMPIHAAKWLYRWTDPVTPPRAKKHVSKYGTPVKVI
jgi:hypothetical protein